MTKNKDLIECADTTDDFNKSLERMLKGIIEHGKGKCCVCHHDLDAHIDEGEHWRCHSLAADFYQCECTLYKAKAKNDIKFYDLSRRAEEQLKDVEFKCDIKKSKLNF